MELTYFDARTSFKAELAVDDVLLGGFIKKMGLLVVAGNVKYFENGKFHEENLPKMKIIEHSPGEIRLSLPTLNTYSFGLMKRQLNNLDNGVIDVLVEEINSEENIKMDVPFLISHTKNRTDNLVFSPIISV